MRKLWQWVTHLVAAAVVVIPGLLVLGLWLEIRHEIGELCLKVKTTKESTKTVI